jgi:hypothetical protein
MLLKNILKILKKVNIVIFVKKIIIVLVILNGTIYRLIQNIILIVKY